jgi:hypothetical protein
MSASAVVYAGRSISWGTVTLGSGAVFPAGVIFPDTVIEERHDDDTVISENPIEIGTVNNDNAFDLPQELEVTYVWSAGSPQANGDPGFLQSMYQRLLDLKQAKISLYVVTGKRQYQNLELKNISVITDRDTENALVARLGFRQLLLTYTQTVIVAPASQHAQPQKTMPTINGGTVSLQPGNNYNSGTSAG